MSSSSHRPLSGMPLRVRLSRWIKAWRDCTYVAAASAIDFGRSFSNTLIGVLPKQSLASESKSLKFQPISASKYLHHLKITKRHNWICRVPISSWSRKFKIEIRQWLPIVVWELPWVPNAQHNKGGSARIHPVDGCLPQILLVFLSSSFPTDTLQKMNRVCQDNYSPKNVQMPHEVHIYYISSNNSGQGSSWTLYFTEIDEQLVVLQVRTLYILYTDFSRGRTPVFRTPHAKMTPHNRRWHQAREWKFIWLSNYCHLFYTNLARIILELTVITLYL